MSNLDKLNPARWFGRNLSCATTALIIFTASHAAGPTEASVKLEVSELSVYRVDGNVVAAPDLVKTLLAKRKAGQPLRVYVIPTLKAPYKAVETAVKAVQDAGGVLGMVGNAVFE